MPGFFDQIFSGLFPKGKGSQPVQVQEPIVRSAEELKSLQIWSYSEEAKSLYDQVYRSYHLREAKINNKPEVHVFASSYANGFALSYQEEMGKQHFQFFFDSLKDKVIEMGYRLASSDRKIEEKSEYINTLEKHYLKPPLQDPIGGLIDQMFGNILIEYVQVNTRPSYIKVLASVYSDRLYKDAGDFNDFMDRLFSQA